MIEPYYKKILVAVDGSDQSLWAVEYIGRMIKHQNVKLVLFHVYSGAPDSLWDLEEDPLAKAQEMKIGAWWQRQEESMGGFMKEARRILLDQGLSDQRISVTVQHRIDGIARDIVSESLNGYQAVVMGGTGLNKIKDLVLGSTAHKLLGKINHIPLCVVTGKPDTDKILIGVDASPSTLDGLDFMPFFAAQNGKEVYLLHAVRSFKLPPYLDYVPEIEAAEEKWFKSRCQMAKPFLEEAKKRLMQAGFSPDKIITRIITGVESRAESIVREAWTKGCGTILVGRRGLSKVDEFFSGRVSYKVVQLARQAAVWVIS